MSELVDIELEQRIQETESFVVHLDGFEGPLDLLLQLARTQKVDLAKISILQLVEQYLEIIESARKIRLELAADWLVMAAWLAWLKSCLLLPEKPVEGEETEQAVDILQERLEELERINQAAKWMSERPLLGSEVFVRGFYENHTEIDTSGVVLDISRFMGAYVGVARRKSKKKAWRLRSFNFWTVRDALSRLKRLLGQSHVPGWHVLDAFLPSYTSLQQNDTTPEMVSRQVKAAWSGTLLAGLELAKDGQIQLNQQEQFGRIQLRKYETNSIIEKENES
ncbi:ScpA family protein [Commensalibacter papalotli (ex Botero et al. 2024)]|uniref:Segregation and condensation protein A n=1 Tax=Commensalibacter papalotli (ex Botero et al. 2024) TaxID=2972766 RepID=A0ABN8WCH0_9PROT|nr:ScpA family protein [Commensalibacter papalotli (ex Botero et al. 2024)]CAI3934888.1 Chromatin segregation and condensation protein Rec8/ScpA/Scc1 [Commensalibacter papalotli (ex Botero et al. 2024)]CAI3951011.1 Chromatin segregation and condensation protein Rec8/ScpA/Scc1 [Commensalibacter papalotli (ex Botero et al. 2024)]